MEALKYVALYLAPFAAFLLLQRIYYAIKDARWRRSARQSWAMDRVLSGMRFGEYSDEWLQRFADASPSEQWRIYDEHFQNKRKDLPA